VNASAVNSAPLTKKVCDYLVREGLLDASNYEAVLQHVQRTGERVEECILELGFITEPELLKALATLRRTRFVTSEKLARAEIEKSTLDLIPKRFAEQSLVFPVLFDSKTMTISVVAADPDDLDMIEKVQMASRAREVKAFLARPLAVKAIVAKYYGGDIHAFAMLDRQAHAQFQNMLDHYERNLVSDASMATSLAMDTASGRGERMISETEMTNSAQGQASQASKSSFSGEEFLELLNVLVSLLESGRPDLRGHSAYVARFMRRMVERMKIPPPADVAIVAAAYIHDLGKMGQFHLTALNVSEYDGHKVAAQKVCSAPPRLLEGVRMASETLQAVLHMYERFDGKGLPDAMSGKDIPLGARLLAIVDTYSDLTQNPRNPFRKALSATEACGVLAKYRETILDPHLVDLFCHMVMGEDLRAKLLANRYNALIIDVDPEETTVLELRMIEQGFEVKTARAADQALKILPEGEIDIVISELELPQMDGLKLLAHARAQPWGKELPWVIYTRKQGRVEAQRAFELNVNDYVAKPASTDVLVAKLKAMLDQRATKAGPRGVSGSLKEMGLPDMIQVLSGSKKTGNLRIRSAGASGEVHLQDGNVVNALWGELRGEEAFYALLRLEDGEFGLDPSFRPPARVINQTSESLLLEGMRRADEG
jgi:response regulator RpfG family c-di-GMP phosphodiesterase